MMPWNRFYAVKSYIRSSMWVDPPPLKWSSFRIYTSGWTTSEGEDQLFVLTLLFAIGAVSRVGSDGANLAVWIAVVLGLLSLAAFLFLIDYAARPLRPVSIVWHVGEEGRAVLEEFYPRSLKGSDEVRVPAPRLDPAVHVVKHRGKSAIILAANIPAILAEAERVEAVIVFLPRVGDFIATGDPLFQVHGARGRIDEGRLESTVAFGRERTLERIRPLLFA